MFVNETLKLISENWFLQEPAFFALLCQQQLTENVRMESPIRCGQGRLEYNPLLLSRKNYAEVEQLMRVEMIRLFLKHPYERQPEGCSKEALSIGSDITIGDGYCMLHKEKLPVRDPGYYHLPLGQYYEWYAKQIQGQKQEDERQKDSQSNQNDPSNQSNQSNQNNQNNPKTLSTSPFNNPEDKDKSQLWRDDEMQRLRINELINRTTDWGTLPGEIVEQIKASTKAKINNRHIWEGFHSTILSSQRHLTRMRPNRRTGFLQMGSMRQFDTHLLIAIDTSGSITESMLENFYGSINRMFRYGIVKIDLCQFDAEMSPIEPLQHTQRTVQVKGRGGTSYQPIFDYIMHKPHDYDGLIILTDGQAPPPTSEGILLKKGAKYLHTPILWVCNDKVSYEVSHEWMEKTGRCCHL
jgi:predicted metal-dependent peptidase